MMAEFGSDATGQAMARRLKINTLLISALAALSWAYFDLSKHSAALAAVNPFAEDPYDAIGSFGVQVAAFLAILAWIRVFVAYFSGSLSPERQVLLARTQMLAVLAVGVTLAGDIVAVLRYPSLWFGLPAGYQLATLLAGLLLLTIAAGARLRQLVGALGLHGAPGAAQKAAVVSLGAAAALAVYPDSWRESTPGALFTVLVGAVLLFAPMRAWADCLVPYPAQTRQHEATTPSAWLHQHRLQLGAVILVGTILGLLLVLAESTEGGAWPSLARFVLVAAVYVGLETAGLLIGYVSLRKPLGLP
jgi:hypothetical protein